MLNEVENQNCWEERYLASEVQNAILMVEISALKAEISALKVSNELKDEKIIELNVLNRYYIERLRLAAKRKFCSSSENSAQYSLFNEAEAIAKPDSPEPTIEEIQTPPVKPRAKKQPGKRDEDFAHLPTEIVVHELSEEERICECGNRMKEIGSYPARREIVIIPAQVKVKQHVAKSYVCSECEKTAANTVIVKAPIPEPVIKGSATSPSAVAYVMNQKYVMSNPLYRIEQEFDRSGINISRQTMANWMIKSSESWLESIYAYMKDEMLTNAFLHADETTLQVLEEAGRLATSKSYMWLYRTTGTALRPVVLYEYTETREAIHPKTFLKGWKGYLHTDGYEGYHTLPEEDITIVGCWTHVRRKFDDALSGMTAEERLSSKAFIGFEYCNQLFKLEREFEKMTPEERHKNRLEKSLPIVFEFFDWAENLLFLPKSLLGTAITYAVNQKKYLLNFLLDGNLELSNNRAERSIKPFVMGRKNWMFSKTPEGARASAVIYSVIETAKENNLIPFEYLKFLFEQLPNATSKQIPSLLPWGEAVPDYCKNPKKLPPSQIRT